MLVQKSKKSKTLIQEGKGKSKPNPRQVLRDAPGIGKRTHCKKGWAQKTHFAVFPVFSWGTLSYGL